MADKEKKYEVIFCIINTGFVDTVMYAARKAGATGGTIMKGHGAGSLEAEEVFNITIQPEKEVIMILVPAEIKDDVMKSIYTTAGLDSEGHGIIFSLPVTKTAGLRDFEEKAETNAD
ncbi:MAG: P-II family nitrogen regulator [Solobacterium sp.]|nr:P-II family nitrogen regulator [Solobacterium sp.]